MAWTTTWTTTDDGRVKVCDRCGEENHLSNIECARCMHNDNSLDGDFIPWLEAILTKRDEKLRKEMRAMLREAP